MGLVVVFIVGWLFMVYVLPLLIVAVGILISGFIVFDGWLLGRVTNAEMERCSYDDFHGW